MREQYSLHVLNEYIKVKDFELTVPVCKAKTVVLEDINITYLTEMSNAMYEFKIDAEDDTSNLNVERNLQTVVVVDVED